MATVAVTRTFTAWKHGIREAQERELEGVFDATDQ